MRTKLANTEPRTFVLVFDPGDDVITGIERFCEESGMHAAGLTGIGAFSNSTLGYFLISTKQYKNIQVDEQVEVLSLVGDVVLYNGRPKLHAHVVIGKSDGSAHGGHLLKATVNPTLEVVITELPAYLHREMNESFGIPLIRL